MFIRSCEIWCEFNMKGQKLCLCNNSLNPPYYLHPSHSGGVNCKTIHFWTSSSWTVSYVTQTPFTCGNHQWCHRSSERVRRLRNGKIRTFLTVTVCGVLFEWKIPVFAGHANKPNAPRRWTEVDWSRPMRGDTWHSGVKCQLILLTSGTLNFT